MTLRVEFQTSPVARSVRVGYRGAEFSLNYRHQPSREPSPPSLATLLDERLGIRPEGDFFAIADTLEIVFAGEERELVGVEAYTNWQQWQRSSILALPRLSGTGRICLADSFPDDRIRLNVVPVYTYSQNQRLLRISLAPEPEHPRYYCVSDSLIVGVDRDELAVLLIQHLSIDEASGTAGSPSGVSCE